MIVVEAHLFSAARSSSNATLCRVEIANDGSRNGTRGSYDVRLYARNSRRLIRTARVENFPRQAVPAWRLIAAAMRALEDKGRL